MSVPIHVAGAGETEGNAQGPPLQADDTTGLWLQNPQFELHLREPRTLVFISVGQEDRRAAGAAGAAECAEPVGFCVVPLHAIQDKGPSLTRQV